MMYKQLHEIYVLIKLVAYKTGIKDYNLVL